MVALNKIDVAKANPEAVEDQLFKMGVNIEPKGGNIPVKVRLSFSPSRWFIFPQPKGPTSISC